MMRVEEHPGNERVFNVKIGGAVKITELGIRHGFFALGKDLKATANKEILRRPKGGRTYIIRTIGGRRRHVASAPGETHANLSGKLRRSLGWSVRGFRELEFGYTDGIVPDYAPFVEFGTRRMAKRPTLKNAIDVTIRNAEVYFSSSIMKEFS